MPDEPPILKVAFPIDPQGGYEWLWCALDETYAELVFRVRNVPIHVRGVEFHDLVRVRFEKDDATESEFAVFDGLVESSGNVRFLVTAVDPAAGPKVRELRDELDLLLEDLRGELFALSVPPNVALAEVESRLEEGQDVLWRFSRVTEE